MQAGGRLLLGSTDSPTRNNGRSMSGRARSGPGRHGERTGTHSPRQTRASRPEGRALTSTSSRPSVHHLLANLTAVLFSLALLVLFTGILNRLEGLQGVCSEWPFCLVPLPRNTGAWLALSHRLLSALLPVIMLPWLLGIVLHHGLRRRTGGAAILAAALLAGQAWLLHSAPTLTGLPATIHLMLALLFAAALVYVWQRSHSSAGPRGENAPVPIAHAVQAALAVLLLSQAVTGSHLARRQEGLACPEFPACHVERIVEKDGARLESRYLPSPDPLQSDRHRAMQHRWMGFALVAISLWLLHRTRRMSIAPANALLLALLGLQILLGAFSVKWGLPMLGRLLHAATGMAAFLLAFWNTLVLDTRGSAPTRRPL